MTGRLYGYGTHVGNIREENEDNFCVAPEIGLWAVADGMGGYKGGKTASRITVRQLAEDVLKGLSLAESISEIHHTIIHAAKADPAIRGMGATVVAMRTTEDVYEIVWVGDSRAYLWDGARLKQITRDHSYVQHLVKEGIISEAEAAVHPSRHAVTQALGAEELEALDVETVSGILRKNEQILLCSDGLTSEVDNERISGILLMAHSPQTAVDMLINEARANGGSDNITVILVSVSGEDGV